MTLAEKESLPIVFKNGWPATAQFAFRQKDGTLAYYHSNPRAVSLDKRLKNERKDPRNSFY